jgi:hypothetical protein
VKQPKQFSVIGRDATGFYFLCYGPDDLTLRDDLNRALSVVKIPRLIEINAVRSSKLPCLIVKGKKEELENIQQYLASEQAYSKRVK